MFAALHDRPAPPSEVAEQVETSLPNVRYHLDKLEAADLIEVVDVRYSERGFEMDVYAPTDDPLFLFAGVSQFDDGGRDGGADEPVTLGTPSSEHRIS